MCHIEKGFASRKRIAIMTQTSAGMLEFDVELVKGEATHRFNR